MSTPHTDRLKVLPFVRISPRPGERYRTCVPLLTMEAAAGAFGHSTEVECADWVVPSTKRNLRDGMFVTQVMGKSMEPRIPDGAYCLFASPVEGSRQGRIVLVQHHSLQDPETGGRYTVKRYESEKVESAEGGFRHVRIRLVPLNPAFSTLLLNAEEEGQVTVIAELVEVLRAQDELHHDHETDSSLGSPTEQIEQATTDFGGSKGEARREDTDGIHRRLTAVERLLKDLSARLDKLEVQHTSGRSDALLAALDAYLMHHLGQLSDVQAIFVDRQRDPIQIIIVLSGPGDVEDHVYEVIDRCLLTFTALNLESTVLYRQNLSDLKGPYGAIRIYPRG